MVPQAWLIDLRHGDAASPAWVSLEHPPPTHRGWLWGQPVSEDRFFVQCRLVTCWLCDLDLGLSFSFLILQRRW